MTMVEDPTGGVGLAAAFLAGAISFLSPCVLPLVPGYLSAVTGVAYSELDTVSWKRVLVPSVMFVASFSLIFILLGLTATGIGSVLGDNRRLLEKISAVVIVTMGIFFIATLFIDRINKEWHVDALMERAGKGGPVVAGAAFALAWTPCIGPTLSAILAAAALSETAGRGALLLGFYSAGLAVPFLLTAVAFSKMSSAFKVMKRIQPALIAVGGAILIVMGVLIWTGEFFRLNIEAQKLLNDLGIDFSSEY